MNWRAASSVILLNTEIRYVLMMKRGSSAKFMPNSLVFPGGLLDPTDKRFPSERSNYHLVDAQPIQMQGFEDDYAFRIAALRELFEESGILLIFNANCRTSELVTVADDPKLVEWKQKVCESPSKFADLFTTTQLADVNTLIPWSNWLTPKSYKRRFDTMFFLAAVNSDCDSPVDFCEREMAEAEWVHPSTVIERSSGKCEVSLPPPQFYELARVRFLNCQSNEQFLQHANPMRITPQVVEAIDDVSLRCALLPGDHLYVTHEAEEVDLKRMTSKEIIPNKEIDELRTIHRLTYRTSPLAYTNHEIHAKNLHRMPHKMHLFYFNGDSAFDWPF